MGFADCIGGEMEKVRPVRAAFLSEQFEGLFGDRVEFASGLAEGIVGDDLRGELLSSRSLCEQFVRPYPFRIVPSEGMYFEQLSLRGELSDSFHDGGKLFRGDFSREGAAEKRAPVRFERATERLVDEGQRGVGKKCANKVGT